MTMNVRSGHLRPTTPGNGPYVPPEKPESSSHDHDPSPSRSSLDYGEMSTSPTRSTSTTGTPSTPSSPAPPLPTTLPTERPPFWIPYNEKGELIPYIDFHESPVGEPDELPCHSDASVDEREQLPYRPEASVEEREQPISDYGPREVPGTRIVYPPVLFNGVVVGKSPVGVKVLAEPPALELKDFDFCSDATAGSNVKFALTCTLGLAGTISMITSSAVQGWLSHGLLIAGGATFVLALPSFVWWCATLKTKSDSNSSSSSSS